LLSVTNTALANFADLNLDITFINLTYESFCGNRIVKVEEKAIPLSPELQQFFSSSKQFISM
jgi:hypothetical protein